MGKNAIHSLQNCLLKGGRVGLGTRVDRIALVSTVGVVNSMLLLFLGAVSPHLQRRMQREKGTKLADGAILI
eukprot:1075430-Pelagomonas_calceolata.AAC.2